MRMRRLTTLTVTECSAKHNRGVQEAIFEAAQVSLSSRPRGGGRSVSLGDHGCCIIL